MPPPARRPVGDRCSILVVATIDDGWTWLSSYFNRDGYRWSFHKGNLLAGGRRAWLRHALGAARIARNYDLVVSHGPWLTLFLACGLWLFRCRTPHIAYTFNHGNGRFFTGAFLWVARRALRSVDFFVTFSTLERHIYARAYAIPIEKIGFTHWAVQKPTRGDSLPSYLRAGEDYVACLGRNNRDFPTLLQAVAGLPTRVVVICGAGQLDGLPVPANVVVRTDVSAAECDQVLDHCLASIVPILDDSRGVGHMTIVSALLRGVPLIVTRSAGIEDYVQDGANALLVDRGSVEDLRSAITRIAADPELRARLSRSALAFADTWLTEAAAARYLDKVLRAFRTGAPYPTGPGDGSAHPS
jgi:glycosyltransferase involved in cell wall biosynthesis